MTMLRVRNFLHAGRLLMVLTPTPQAELPCHSFLNDRFSSSFLLEADRSDASSYVDSSVA